MLHPPFPTPITIPHFTSPFTHPLLVPPSSPPYSHLHLSIHHPTSPFTTLPSTSDPSFPQPDSRPPNLPFPYPALSEYSIAQPTPPTISLPQARTVQCSTSTSAVQYYTPSTHNPLPLCPASPPQTENENSCKLEGGGEEGGRAGGKGDV